MDVLEQEEALREKMKSDDQAFFEFYEKYFDVVYRYAVRRVGHGDYLKRILNRTFYRAYHQIEQFFDEDVPFRAWILRTAKQVADEMGAAMRTDVDGLLVSLDQRDLEMVIFKVFEKLPDNEVAYVLDVEDGVFTPLYYRLLAKLKSKIS